MHETSPIDLHCHSRCSDGALSPWAVVARAAEHGVRTLALTDHDTLAGLPEARAAAAAYDMALIAGVEISVTWQRRTLHVVGLAVDPSCDTLRAGLRALRARRRARAEAIAAKLETLGEHDVLDRARALAGPAEIGRAHLATTLVDSGRCKDLSQAFRQFLKPGRPAHVRVEWAALAEAIGWIHAAGGLAVLAHPFGYGLTAAWRRRAVRAFADAGGDALETATGVTDPAQEAAAERDALEYRLRASIGSDFHSSAQRWLALGALREPRTVPAIWRAPAFRALSGS